MKKILSYILILVFIAGIFGPVLEARASQTNPNEICDSVGPGAPAPNAPCKSSPTDKGECTTISTNNETNVQAPVQRNECVGGEGVLSVKFKAYQATDTVPPPGTTNTYNTASSGSALYDKLDSCGIAGNITGAGGTIEGCIQHVIYFFSVVISSALLAIVAKFFNFMAAFTLSSTMYTSDFIGSIWKVVRDFANIFFILVLLYAAFEMILGIGHGGGKKIIGTVVLMALVVNFSLFFTKVVIDSSNILALVFYNKIDVSSVKKYVPVGDALNSGVKEKDMAGALVSAFNINSFFDGAKLEKINASYQEFGVDKGLNTYVKVSIMVIYGIVIYVLAYAFFIAALSFFGRMISLMMLMVVSPFAFVSYAVPAFKKIDTIGFDSWLHKLLENSFVAAIFMFIIYVTSAIIQSPIFQIMRNGTWTGMVQTLIMLFMPALLIVILLLKGAKYAQKASGEFTGAVVGIGKAVAGLAGGVALGVASGGTAMVARGTIGRAASNLAESNKFRDWASRTPGGKFISERVSGLASRTFDARNTSAGKSLAKTAGINVDAAKSVGLGVKKGFTENRAAAVKKQEEFATKMLDTTDFGKAQLSRGNMSVANADKVMNQLWVGGLTDTAERTRLRNALLGNGIETKELSTIASHLDAARRNRYADRLEDRKANWRSGAGARLARKRVSANKIRTDAKSLKNKRDVKHAIEEIAHEVSAHSTPHNEEHPAPAAAHPAPATPPAGGGAPGAAHPPTH